MSETRWIKGQDRRWHEIGPDDRDWNWGISKEELDSSIKIANGQACPACSSDQIDIANGIRQCRSCNGIFTTRENSIPLNKAVEIVNIRKMEEGRTDPYHNQYFDFYIEHPDFTITRVHGWFNNITRRVTQFG